MHTFIAISEIKVRAEALRLSLSELAVKAGVAPSTVLRLAAGTGHGGWMSTNQKLVSALEAEEQRVRDHLQRLKEAS
jgi:DNA-binding MurR/RpiR family transcriptional regulator